MFQVEFEDRSPVTNDEIWVYKAADGWTWRADYIGGRESFETEAEARQDAETYFKENGELVC